MEETYASQAAVSANPPDSSSCGQDPYAAPDQEEGNQALHGKCRKMPELPKRRAGRANQPDPPMGKRPFYAEIRTSPHGNRFPMGAIWLIGLACSSSSAAPASFGTSRATPDPFFLIGCGV